MQPKSSTSGSSSPSGLGNSKIQLELPKGTEVVSQSNAVEEVTSSQASSAGVMVTQWSPIGVEKVWYEFIKSVKSEVSLDNVKAVCNAMGVMQFSIVSMFQGFTPRQLIESRKFLQSYKIKTTSIARVFGPNIYVLEIVQLR